MVLGGLYTGCGCGVVRGVVRESSRPTSVKNSKGNPLSWPFPMTFSFSSTVILGRGVVVVDVVVVVVVVVVIFGIELVAITEDPILLLNTRTTEALEDHGVMRAGAEVTGCEADDHFAAELLDGSLGHDQVLGVVATAVG